MTDIPKENGEQTETPIKDPATGRFLPGNPGGPGRPQGSISIITRIKQKFEENPEFFETYVSEVLSDPKLRAEVIRQIDGAPRQSTDITSGGEQIQPLLVRFLDNESNGDPQGV